MKQTFSSVADSLSNTFSALFGKKQQPNRMRNNQLNDSAFSDSSFYSDTQRNQSFTYIPTLLNNNKKPQSPTSFTSSTNFKQSTNNHQIQPNNQRQSQPPQRQRHEQQTFNIFNKQKLIGQNINNKWVNAQTPPIPTKPDNNSNPLDQIDNQQMAHRRPYMVFVYSQRFHVQGEGTYELKITNVINPYTMKTMPLQPSLIDPAYLISEGIGNSKKALGLDEDQLGDLIMKQNGVNKFKEKRQSKPFTGAQVRMLTCQLKQRKKKSHVNEISKSEYAPSIVSGATNSQIKRQQRGAKILKYLIQEKLSQVFRDLNQNSWGYENYRRQLKMKNNLTMLKIAGIINGKIKQQKFQAFGKIKEHSLVQSSVNSNNSIGDNTLLKKQQSIQNNTPSTAAQSLMFGNQLNSKIHKNKIQAAKMLAYHLGRKVLERKLQFWLQFRTNKINIGKTIQQKAVIQELKIQFGEKVMNKQQLEDFLNRKFNKVELNKIDDDYDSMMVDDEEQKTDRSRKYSINEQSVLHGRYLNNISAIRDLHISRHDESYSDFVQDLNILDPLVKANKTTQINKKLGFQPVLYEESEEESTLKQSQEHESESLIITQGDYKVVKLDKDLDQLKEEVQNMNQDIERMKKFLLDQQEMDQMNSSSQDDSFQFQDEQNITALSFSNQFPMQRIYNKQVIHKKIRNQNVTNQKGNAIDNEWKSYLNKNKAKQNLNDSRSHDFEGFDEVQDDGEFDFS